MWLKPLMFHECQFIVGFEVVISETKTVLRLNCLWMQFSADLKHGGLPAPSHKYAKLYIETVVKDKLKRSQQNDNNN
jgi:hypothetical protein